MPNANYNGRVGNNTTNTRYFIEGQPTNIWIPSTYNGTTQVITPSSTNYQNVYIPGNLYVDGSIINPSDLTLKDNIVDISNDLSDAIMKLKPSQFTFKSDKANQVHYGFIAQEFEEHFPELVTIKPISNLNPNPNMSPSKNPITANSQNIKAINYLEILPLLVHKVQSMQQEIDELKAIIINKQ
jgi:hypothetical protein